MSTDDSTEQTAAAFNTMRGASDDLSVTPQERIVLRELALRVRELSERPIEREKIALWRQHNDLGNTRPLVFIDPENGWNEIVRQDQLLCHTPLLRGWEMRLQKEIFWAEHMKDDRVIEPFFDVPYTSTDTEWGLKEQVVRTDRKDGAFVYISPIKNYDEAFPLLAYPEITVDYKHTKRVVDLATGILGDILKVRLRGFWWWTLGMTWDFIKLRGLENLMLDMMDQPENVHRLMGFLRDGMMRKLDFLEQEGLLSSNVGGTYVGSGGFGWTDQLPPATSDNGGARLADMWGFAESQETVGVSPAMFAEFILPYQIPILERFGLNCYGCCEPLDARWQVVKQIPRLRRVSVSPWANPAVMGEFLRKEYILSLKPSPTPLAQPNMDEDVVRSQLRSSLAATRDNVVEVIMKDNHTLGGNPQNATRWVEIARAEISHL